MKLFILKPNEDWIVDRFAREYFVNHQKDIVDSIDDAEIVWLLADWAWNQIPKRKLIHRKVLTTVHHIVPEKFDLSAKYDFLSRDDITDIYHVPCIHTRRQIGPLTKKPILIHPFWVNQNLWYPLSKRGAQNELRKKYGIPDETFIVGSFQRDTEGHDLISPKLEKGPDLFCDAVEKYREKYGDVFVVLAGWRRQYVIKRLESLGIKYLYVELPKYSVLKELYHTLDLYVVASRYEGGPMAIVECAASKVPIVSRDVGIASKILAPRSVGENVIDLEPSVDFSFKQVTEYYMPRGFEPFEKIFKKMESRI